jgi:hypothetical protein
VALAAAEVRLAKRVVGVLSSQPVGHDIEQRLRVGRQQAVARAAARRHAQALAAHAAPGLAVAAWTRQFGSAFVGGPVSPNASTPWWQRVGMVLPLLALVAGLYGIDQWSLRETVLAAAEVDVLLLADDLPPAAYTDPGFGEFLRSPAE